MRLDYGVLVDGTESFRFAMNVHPFGKGLNAQTMPKVLRYYLVAPPGRVFVGGDQAQAEAREVAYLSQCKDLIEVFNDCTRNVHLENALAVFGHEVIRDSPEYVAAKSVVHGIHYGEGPKKISMSTGIELPTTKALIQNYHGRRPEIKKWHKWTYDKIARDGQLETPFGDVRVFYEAISCLSLTGKIADNLLRDAIAWIPQTTVPHLTNLGICALRRAFGDDGFCWFHHQGHDSFLCSIPEGEEQRFADVALKVFAIPQTIWGVTFVIPTELTIGYNFGDMMKFKGSSISRGEWQEWLDGKLAKKSRHDDLLEGTYGHILKGWRP